MKYPSKFKIVIKLENDGMRDTFDVVGALDKITRKLRNTSEFPDGKTKIMDVNGNAVGYWEAK